MPHSPTLVLVCKRPKLGFSKQRLVANLGMERTQHIAQALLDCALEDAQDWDNPVVIAPSSQQDKNWAATLISSLSVQILPQTSGNLGQRLNALDIALRNSGSKQLIFIGSDAPALSPIDYRAVIRALEHQDTVLIPATDGGVVLMASNRPWPDMTHLPWSTNHLGEELANCCRAVGQSVIFLKQSFDIDESSDLIKLTETLANDPRPARQLLYKLVNKMIVTTDTNHAPT
jgi:glycosyltransferase A (GT-A) superfamily protein (DUF2064 family)